LEPQKRVKNKLIRKVESEACTTMYLKWSVELLLSCVRFKVNLTCTSYQICWKPLSSVIILSCSSYPTIYSSRRYSVHVL